MPGAFSSDEAEESTGTKPNFIGEIVRSEPTDSDDGISDEYRDDDKDYYEFLYEIEPLAVSDGDGGWEDRDWSNLMQYGVEISNNFRSKWMFLIGHLENIHGDLSEAGIEGKEDLAEALEGRVYEFREYDFTEDEDFVWEESPDEHTVRIADMFGDSDNAPNSMMVPVEEVDEDTLEDLDTPSEDEDVEEVEL